MRHTYGQPGTYPVTLYVTDSSGTVSSTRHISAEVVINQRPVADAGPDQIAAPGETVRLAATGSYDPDGAVTSHLWSFGDGATANGPVVRHAFAQPGVYTVSLTVADDSGDAAAVDHDAVLVRVNAAPVAVAGADMRVAPGETVRLDGGRSYDPDGTVRTARWELSDGQSSTGAMLVTELEQPGVVRAELEVRDDSDAANGSATDEVMIHVNHAPVAVAGGDVRTCDRAVTFDGGGSADPDGDPLLMRWDFGDGSIATGRTVTHVYTEGGVYPVTLTVDDGTGLANASSRDAITVTINQPPQAAAGDDQLACAGEPVLLDGSGSVDPDGGALRYSWSFSDGASADIINPTRTFSDGGVYTAALTVTDDSGLECGSDVDRLVVRVAEAPRADAGGDRTVCANSVVRFDGSASTDSDGVVSSFRWELGDGTSARGEVVEHRYREPGTYPVVLTVTGDRVGECDNRHSDEITVVVQPAPVAQIAAPTVVAAGEAVELDGSGSMSDGAAIVSWSWDLGDGSAAQGPAVTHRWDEPGRYRTTLTVSTSEADVCSAVAAQHTVLVNAAPTAVAGADRTVGVHQPVVLDASQSSDPDGVLADAIWDLGDGRSVRGLRASAAWDEPGTYTVRLTVEDDSGALNGSATSSLKVTVLAPPELAVDAPSAVCVGEPVAMTVAVARAEARVSGERAVHLQWTFPDGHTASGPTVERAFARAGQVEVTVVGDDGLGLTTSRSQVVHRMTVNRPPTAKPGAPQVVCPGDPVVLDGVGSFDPDGDALRLSWSTEEGRALASGSPSWEVPGSHTLVLTADDGAGTSCSVATAMLPVRVNGRPVARAGEDFTAWTGGALDVAVLDARGSEDPDGDQLTYLWDLGDGSTARGPVVQHAYSEPGRYTARLTVSDSTGLLCGSATDEVTVTVAARGSQ